MRFQVDTTLWHKRPEVSGPGEEAGITIHVLDDVIRVTLWGGEETHVFIGHFSQSGASCTHVTALINDPRSVVEVSLLRESSEEAFLEVVEAWLRTQVEVTEGFLMKGVEGIGVGPQTAL